MLRKRSLACGLNGYLTFTQRKIYVFNLWFFSWTQSGIILGMVLLFWLPYWFFRIMFEILQKSWLNTVFVVIFKVGIDLVTQAFVIIVFPQENQIHIASPNLQLFPPKKIIYHMYKDGCYLDSFGYLYPVFCQRGNCFMHDLK